MADSSLWMERACLVSLTRGGMPGLGWKREKKEGYLWKNLEDVMERSRRGLRREASERGRDLEGSERIWFLKEMACLRSFSLSTAKSRYGSRTHLTFASTKVRVGLKR